MESAATEPADHGAPGAAPGKGAEPVSLIDDVGLLPLPGDLVRVEDRLNEAIRADDRFLGDVAGHLLAAGGKRLRPTLALCAGYAAAGAGAPSTFEVVTGGAAVEL